MSSSCHNMRCQFIDLSFSNCTVVTTAQHDIMTTYGWHTITAAHLILRDSFGVLVADDDCWFAAIGGVASRDKLLLLPRLLALLKSSMDSYLCGLLGWLLTCARLSWCMTTGDCVVLASVLSVSNAVLLLSNGRPAWSRSLSSNIPLSTACLQWSNTITVMAATTITVTGEGEE